MKLGFLFFFATFASLTARAEVLKVHSSFENHSSPEITIIKLQDGRTAFWNRKEISNVTLSELKTHKGLIQVDLDESHKVLGLNLIEGFVDEPRLTMRDNILLNQTYQPSILASYQVAQDTINSFSRGAIDGSQCYDKAHRWVYDEHMAYSTKLMKVFLFFSDAYIARTNHPWWFHTAPFAYVRMNNETTERVMDPTFFQHPLKFKIWTDIFMKNKVECKSINKYSEYSKAPNTNDCFIQRVSMYFWQPRDLEAFENTGALKTNFVPWEIDWAYQHGFGMRRPN
jgi:hypothetical protein